MEDSEEEESLADRARLLDSDSEPEQPDPVAARATIAPYLEDVDSYMRSLEALRRPRDYMLPVEITQGAITPTKRAKVVDWLVEVAADFKLLADTLHLAVSYFDRFLSVGVIIPSELQLLGVTALLVAAKFENDMHKVEKYSDITDNTYTKQQVVKMEADILKLLKFEMGSPTARIFLRLALWYVSVAPNNFLKGDLSKSYIWRYITLCRRGDRAKAKTLEFMCSYLAELSLLDYDCTMFKPSVVAAACLFLARFTISPKNRPWNGTLQRKTGYKVSDLDCCILTIHELQLIGGYPGLEEEAIKLKYGHSELESVSAMASPRKIPEKFLKDIKQ